MSFTLLLGARAPDFHLKATDNKNYSLNNFEGSKGLVIVFTCNHCPFVINSDENTRDLAEKYRNKGIQFVCINSNSEHTVDIDSFENMVLRMTEKKFPWVYLRDHTQEIAKAYGALKTPHFFLFNEKRELIYTGRAVDQPMYPSLVSTHELQDAIEEFLEGKSISEPITNPVGCNIKWEGQDFKWMPPEACDLVPINHAKSS